MSENLIMSLQLLGWGMGGVFVTLAAFIVMIFLLVKVFPARAEKVLIAKEEKDGNGKSAEK